MVLGARGMILVILSEIDKHTGGSTLKNDDIVMLSDDFTLQLSNKRNQGVRIDDQT